MARQTSNIVRTMTAFIQEKPEVLSDFLRLFSLFDERIKVCIHRVKKGLLSELSRSKIL